MELVLEVANHTSFKDHSQWLLANRRHERYLSRALYLRLAPSNSFSTSDPEKQGTDDERPFTRSSVVRWAVECGCVRTLEKLEEADGLESLNEHVTVQWTQPGDKDIRSVELLPLHQAALYGHGRVIEYLLQKGANVNAISSGGMLPIHFSKTEEVVQILLRHGSRPDMQGPIPPLINALSYQAEPSAVMALLRLGADPNQVTPDGMTAAEVAIARGNVDILEILLQAGADVNRSSLEGSSLMFKVICSVTEYQSKSGCLIYL